MNKKKITEKNIKLLWGRSGNKCAICQADITEEGKGGDPFPVGGWHILKAKMPALKARV